MIKFQLKKIFHRIPIITFSTIVVVLLLFLFFLETKNEKITMTKEKQTIQEEINKLDNALLEEPIEDGLRMSLEDGLTYSTKKYLGITGNEDDYFNWFINESSLYQTYERTGLEFSSGVVPMEVYAKSNEQARILKEKNIQPLYPLSYITGLKYLSALDENDLKEWDKINEKYYTKGWYFLWKLIKEDYALYLIILIILCLYVPFSHEITSNKKHREFYLSEKISLAKIFFSTFICKLIVSIGITCFIIITFISLTSIANGMGSLDYPIPIGMDSFSKLHFIPLYQYFGFVSLIYICFLILILSFYSLIEVLIKQPVIALALELFILMIGFYFTPFNRYNPFSYLKMNEVITVGFPMNFLEVNYLNIFIISFICSSILLILCYIIIRNKKNKY